MQMWDYPGGPFASGPHSWSKEQAPGAGGTVTVAGTAQVSKPTEKKQSEGKAEKQKKVRGCSLSHLYCLHLFMLYFFL
jgi:hypothetical protein